MLSPVLTFSILSKCDAHLVVAVQRDFWDNVKRILLMNWRIQTASLAA